MSMKEKLLAQRRAQEAAAASTPAPSADKAAAAAAKPAAAKPVAAAKPAASAAPATPATTKPSAARTPAAPASAPKPSAPAAKTRSGARKEVSADVARTTNIIKEKESKIMTYVWISCGVLALAAAFFVYNSVSTQNARKEAAAAFERKLDDTLKTMKDGRDPMKEADAKWLLEKGQELQADWKGTRVEGPIRDVLRRAQNTVDQATERNELANRMSTLENQANNPAPLTLEQVKQARRTAGDLIDKSSLMGDEFKSKAEQARDRLDRAYFDKLIADAKAKGATREALATMTLTEIEVNNALNTASRGKNAERKKIYEDLFKQVIADSDTLAKSVFTQEAIDKEPWKDALSGDQEKKWQKPGVEGFQIINGELQAVGPKKGSGKNGIISIGDSEMLRDFVAEIEFIPVRGNFRFYQRLYQRADNSVPQFDVSTSGNDAPFKPGQAYTVKLSFIGSKLHVEMPDTDITGLPIDEEVSWTKQRFGALGIEMYEDSEIKITKMRFKELRSNKRQ